MEKTLEWSWLEIKGQIFGVLNAGKEERIVCQSIMDLFCKTVNQ